ncbi:hypothetical protein EVAR_15812_1 [Eumeta japonica]|uniref:Uncharacterized protein n=1 Tax=Eumeta variegata TaxID=151549 RepID=A0A4C1TZH1_EUMVA|nr:hypothetical protein EVAR_15812_1 [Eumeta japonica]
MELMIPSCYLPAGYELRLYIFNVYFKVKSFHPLNNKTFLSPLTAGMVHTPLRQFRLCSCTPAATYEVSRAVIKKSEHQCCPLLAQSARNPSSEAIVQENRGAGLRGGEEIAVTV